jgi:hypothetical protein
MPALSDAATGYTVRSSYYREQIDASKVTASRDLKAMVGKGLLEPKGQKRARVYVGTSYLRSIAITIGQTEPKLVADPFAAGVILIP